MKKLLINAALLITLVGCTTIKSGDPVVVNAERVTAVAVDVIDTLLKMEYSNRAFYQSVDPKIKSFCDQLRINAPLYIASARTMTKAYKTNRTEDNKANLATAIAVLETALAEASKILIQVSASQANGTLTNK